LYPYLELFGTQISIYFLFLSFVFSLVVPLIVKRAERLDLSAHFALDLYLVVLLGAFVGARAFYVLYQEPSFYFANLEQVFYFWNGGYVFFGGFIGSVFTGSVYCLVQKASKELWLNFSIPILSFGYAIGRFACFLSGCCYGEKSDAFWSVFMHGAGRHPTQIYASLVEFTILAVLIFVERYKDFKSFLVLPFWLMLHGAGRIFMEIYRADPRGDQVFGLSISSFVSLILITLGAGLFCYKLKRPSYIG